MSRPSIHQPIENPKLTTLIGAELRALPLQRAPGSLQRRVLAELARQQALPWWRRSFRDWPLAAQFGFAIVALLVTHAVFWTLAGDAAAALLQGLRATLLGAIRWVQATGSSLDVLRSVLRDLLGMLPSRWLTAAAMAIASSYLLLVTSGTLVYRSLRSPH